MTEETRTKTAVVDVRLAGAESLDSGLARVEASVARAASALDKILLKSMQLGDAFGVVKDEAGNTGRSFENFASRINSMFGVEKLQTYIAQIHQSTLAWQAGAIQTNAYIATMQLLEKQLPGTMAQYKIGTQDLGKFVSMMEKARAEAQAEAAALNLSGAALETETQKRTENILVRERQVAVMKQQEAAARSLEAAERRQLYAQQNQAQVARIAPAPTQSARDGQIAAFESGLAQRATEAEAYAASLNKLSGASRALFSEADRLAEAERRLARDFQLGDLSASAYQNALVGVRREKLALQREYTGMADIMRREAQEEQEAVARLGALRTKYAEVGSAAQVLRQDLQELNLQFAAGNVRLQEFISLRQRAAAAEASSRPLASANAQLASGQFGAQLGQRLDQSYAQETQRLVAAYNTAGEAAKRLAADQELLNERLRSGKISAQEHATMTASLAQQQELLGKIAQGTGNTFQRQQILQAGLINTIQSLAAGQSVFSTLFIQATQLLGMGERLNTSFLATAAAFTVAAAAAVGMAAAIAKVGDAAEVAQARITAITGSAQQARSAYDALQQIGQRTGVSPNEAAGSFSRLLIGTEQLQATNREVLTLVQTFQQLGIIGGGSTQQISAGMQQFTQAMSKGKLDGDELRSIMENLPLVVRVLTQELGVSVGQLREMGERGQLTSRLVFDALLARAQEVNGLFNAMPTTMERGWNQLKVALEGALVDMNRFLGLSNSLGAAFAAGARGITQIRAAMGGGTTEEQEGVLQAQRLQLVQRLRALTPENTYLSPGMSLEALPQTIVQNGPQPGQAQRNMANRGTAAGYYSDPLEPPTQASGIQQQIAELDRRIDALNNRAGVGRTTNAIEDALRMAGQLDGAVQQAYQEGMRFLRENMERFSPRQAIQERYNLEQQTLSRTQTYIQGQLDNSATPQADRVRLQTELLTVTNALAGSTRKYNEELQQLTATGDRAARQENERVEKLRESLQRMRENVAEVGSSRDTRAFIDFSRKLQDVARDSNEAARQGDLLTQSYSAMAEATSRARTVYAESNRQIALGTQALEDKNAISRLEALGTRESLAQIDQITRTRELERLAIEETNALRPVEANLRALTVQVLEQERDGINEGTQALRARIAVEQEQAVGLRGLYEARRNAINDPANGRLGAELAREQRQAIDYATKLSSDFFYDAFNGKIQSLGQRFKEALMRAVADGIAQQVIRPIIAPIIASGVQAFTGVTSGAGGFFSGIGNSVSSFFGGSMTPQQGQAQQGQSATGAIGQAGSFQTVSRGLGGFNPGNMMTGAYNWNTGLSGVDGVLNTSLWGTSGATQLSATNAAIGAGYGPALPSAVVEAGGSLGGVGGQTIGSLGAGALGVAGGLYGAYSGYQKGGIGGNLQMAGGALTAGLSAAAMASMAVPVYGWIAAAILSIAGALLPGQKPSGKGQSAYVDADTGAVRGYAGLGGDRFSQENRDASEKAAKGIASLAQEIGSKLGGAKLGAEVVVGTTSGRGPGDAGNLYLEIAGRKSEFSNDEGGAKQLAETAARFVLQQFREGNRASGDYAGILNASGDSVEKLNENLKFYEEVYKTFGKTTEVADKLSTAVDEVNSKFDPIISKALELNLSSDSIVAARDKELEAAKKLINEQEALRVSELAAIRANLQARINASDSSATYEARLLSGNVARVQGWANELRSLEDRLKSLSATTEDTASQVAALAQAQAAEYWNNFAESMAELDRSVAGRIMRAQGRTGEADRMDFEAQAAAQIKALSRSLADLGLSADIAAKKIAETEQAIQAERVAKAEEANRQIVALDQSVISRIQRATGQSGKADLREFEISAQEELRNLAQTLSNLGFSAEIVAKKISESEQAIAAERIALQKRVAEEMAASFEKLLNLGQSIRSYIDGKNATSEPGGVSGAAALTAAQTQFGKDLTLARAGDEDALNRITNTADRLLAAGQKQFASGVDYQAIRTFVLASLESLPVTKTYDQLLLEEIRKLGGAVNVEVGVTMIRAITESLNALPEAERNRLIQTGEITRRILQAVAAAGGAPLIGSGNVTRLIDQVVTTQESITVSRSIDDKLGKLLNDNLVVARNQATILAQINSDTNNLWKAAAGVNQPGLRVNSSQWSHDSSSNIVKFAKGGIFDGATVFPMAGGRTGMLGEAGPEAIVPLKRGPDGALGLASGGTGQVVDFKPLMEELRELRKEVAAFRAESEASRRKAQQSRERIAEAAEDTADASSEMAKNRGIVGLRKKAS